MIPCMQYNLEVSSSSSSQVGDRASCPDVDIPLLKRAFEAVQVRGFQALHPRIPKHCEHREVMRWEMLSDAW